MRCQQIEASGWRGGRRRGLQPSQFVRLQIGKLIDRRSELRDVDVGQAHGYGQRATGLGHRVLGGEPQAAVARELCLVLQHVGLRDFIALGQASGVVQQQLRPRFGLDADIERTQRCKQIPIGVGSVGNAPGDGMTIDKFGRVQDFPRRTLRRRICLDAAATQ